MLLTDALKTNEDRLRLVEGRIKMMRNLNPEHTAEIARLEMIRDDLKAKV